MRHSSAGIPGAEPFTRDRVRALVRVVTAAQSAARDAAAIALGTPSSLLMERAGGATAHEIARRFAPLESRRLLVLCGSGNNGGDGWVIARTLATLGIPVDVCEVAVARTDDAIAARASARSENSRHIRELALGDVHSATYDIVVDALLGTGAVGAPRRAIAEAVAVVADLRAVGAIVVAVDLPTGLDATTGDATHAATADYTFTYGTAKRGQLIARGACGELVVLDIGLAESAELADGAPWLVDESWVATCVPVIHADAHKGTRRKVVIVGGAEGMSGAVILAARAALRSGAGMVKVLAHPASLDAIRCADPAVLTAAWPDSDADIDREVVAWADAVAIGPGLGRTTHSRRLVQQLLSRWRGAAVLDADALNVFAGDLNPLAALLGARSAVLTPHPAEFGRLVQATIDDVLAHRFDIGVALAERLCAAVLLKGTPTVISPPDGAPCFVSASGTPVLATGGSGDLLTGITVTLLAQLSEATVAAACAAWVHGRAAELVQLGAAPRRDARGLVLDDVLTALPDAWRLGSALPRAPVLAELPAVEHRA